MRDRLSIGELAWFQDFNAEQRVKLSQSLRQGLNNEATQLGYGSNQLEKVQEMLLSRDAPTQRRRWAFYICPLRDGRCPCHRITAIIDRVDDFFIWHGFLSEYELVNQCLEVEGGPFFFEQSDYSRTLESAA